MIDVILGITIVLAWNGYLVYQWLKKENDE